MSQRFFDRLFLALFIIGLCALLFVAGAGTIQYKLPGSHTLLGALEGGKAWYHRLLEIRAEQVQEGGSGLTDEQLLSDGKVTWEKGKAFEGYTLICLRPSTNVYLLDMNGKTVHSWQLPFAKLWPNAKHIQPLAKAHIFIERAEVMPNGDLIAIFTGTGDTPYGYGMAKVDKDSNVIWTYDQNSHHNFYLRPSGDAIFGLIHKFIDEAPAGLEGLEFPMLADYIVKLSSDGKEQERISILEAIRNSDFASMLYYRTSAEAGTEKWDLLHTNAISELDPAIADKFPLFKAGQLLISLPHMDAIAVIDPTERKVIWVGRSGFKTQHAASFLPNGHIMVFDNNGYATKDKHFSRAIEIDPATNTIVWSFTGSEKQPFYSGIHGFLQRLPNGDTLIADSEEAKLMEVSTGGEIVWSYSMPTGRGLNGLDNSILTAPRYAPGNLTFLEKGTN